MAKEWGEFWRITLSIFSIGAGIGIVGAYLGNFLAVLIGSALVAIGLGLLFMK